MLDVDDRRDDLVEGEGDRPFAAIGESDRCTSEPGVDSRELALANGSDLARILLRLRAIHGQTQSHELAVDDLHRSGGLRASAWCSDLGGSKLACRDGGAKSILISGGDMGSARPKSTPC